MPLSFWNSVIQKSLNITGMNMTTAHYELKKVLQLKLAEMQTRNPALSLRAFAKNLDIHAASLSEFFNDKRQFSPKMTKKIIDKLGLAPDRKQNLLDLLEGNELPTNVERVQIDTDNYFLVSDPIYYSLLCLIETKDFVENMNWMSARLKRAEDQTALALDRLLRLGLLKRDAQGKLAYNAEAHLNTSDDIANTSLRLRHADNLEAAKHALLNTPVEKRYFNFETLAIGQDKLAEAKKIINEARAKLVNLSNSSDKDEVYEFCFNFFPRSFDENENTKTDKLQ
jgi:uncharacterized protein (TIGR02147 family)